MAEKNDQKRDPELEASFRQSRQWKVPTWGWYIVASILVVVSLYGTFTTSKNLTTCPYELKALYALRALGNVELAYQEANESHIFATLDGLKQTGYVQYGYLDNQITPGYRIEITPFTVYDGEINSFVIRIFPTNRTRPCRTFQLGSDREFREFVPMVDSNPHRPENWISAVYLEKQLAERQRLDWMGESYAYN